MKITILRADEEFVAKYSEFIHKEISERYPIIKEAVEFMIRMQNQYANHGIAITFGLSWFQEERGDSLFDLTVEFNEKISFWLHHNDEEPVILDIEGFSCWNSQDEDRMAVIREKCERENGGLGFLSP